MALPSQNKSKYRSRNRSKFSSALTKEHRKNLGLLILGYTFSNYDAFLLGALCLKIVPLFVDLNGTHNHVFWVHFLFFVAFFTRPFGGMVFGYIGDRFSRKTSYITSLLLLSTPSLLLGVLPTHKSIGVTATVSFIFLRLLQGFSAGGILGGTFTYTSEGTDSSLIKSSLVLASGFLGISFALSIVYCSKMIFPEGSDLAWRVPFIFSVFSFIAAVIIKKRLTETPIIIKKTEIDFSYIMEKIKPLKKEIFVCFLFGGVNMIPFHFATLHINFLLSNFLGFSPDHPFIYLNNLCFFLISAVLLIFFSFLGKVIGSKKLIFASVLWFLLMPIPIFFYVSYHMTLINVLFLQAYLAIGNACFLVPILSILPKSFPQKTRFTLFAFTYTLGQAIIGSFSHLLTTNLILKTHCLWLPSIVLSIAFLGVWITLNHSNWSSKK